MANKKEKNIKSRSLEIQSHEPASLRDVINQLIDESFVDPYGLAGDMDLMMHSQTRFPKVNMSETDKIIKLKIEVPGIKEKDLEIEVGEDYIIISGESKFEKEDKSETFYQYESSYGSFTRTIPLPALIILKKTKAELKNGILIIELEKKKLSKMKNIKVSPKKKTATKKSIKKKKIKKKTVKKNS